MDNKTSLVTKPPLGYCLLPVTHTDAIAEAINNLNPDHQYISENSKNSFIKGIVRKTDDSVGPHITLASNVFPHFDQDKDKDYTTLQLAELWESRIHTDITNTVYTPGEPCKIKSVELWQSRDPDENYACVCFKVEVGPHTQKFHEYLDAQFASFHFFGSWNPHVTIGYFKPEHAEAIKDQMQAFIGEDLKTTTKPMYSVS